MQHKIFYYRGQRDAVAHWLIMLNIPRTARNPADLDMHTIDRVRGLEDVFFVEIEGHPNQVPKPMRDQLKATGVTFITIDDRWSRGIARR